MTPHAPDASGERTPLGASIGVYVINLARAADRWDWMLGQLAECPHEIHRVDAWDASTDAEAVLAERGLSLEKPPHTVFRRNPYRWNGRSYLLAEEACFLSHRKALSTFLESANEYGLIMEDDAVTTTGFFAEGGPIAFAIAHASDWDVVKLEGGQRTGGSRLGYLVRKRDPWTLVASWRPSNGACGILVSRQGATELLRASQRAFEPYDTFLTDLGSHSARLLDLSPFPLKQRGAESSIGSGGKKNDPSFAARAMRALSKTRRRFWRFRRYSLLALRTGKFPQRLKW